MPRLRVRQRRSGGYSDMFRESPSLPQVGVVSALRAGAFWGAILLPFVYLPMLVLGLHTVDDYLLFGALVTLNAVLLVVGHSHHSD